MSTSNILKGVIVKNGDDYIAFIQGLPGAAVQGSSEADVKSKLARAANLILRYRADSSIISGFSVHNQ